MEALRKQRNAKTLIILAIAVFAVTAGLLIFHQLSNSNLNSTGIDLALQINQTIVIQGGGLPAQVVVTAFGKEESITLSSTADLPGLKCQFTSSIAVPNSTSTLWIQVPESAPIGNYSLTVMATDSQKTESASCIVTVVNASTLSPNVTVSGFAIDTRNPHAVLNAIQFVDTQTGAKITGDTSQGQYSVNLLNEHLYNVTAQITRMAPLSPPLPYYETLYVYAPQGSDTMYHTIVVKD